MPYSSVDDLPPAVKKRLTSSKKQRQWMHVFNSAHEKYDDEARAFRIANGTVKALDEFNVIPMIIHENDHPLIAFPMFEDDEVEDSKSVDEAHVHDHQHGHTHEHTHDMETHSHWHNHIHEHEHDHGDYDHNHYHLMHDQDGDAHSHGSNAHAHEQGSYKEIDCSCAACTPKSIIDLSSLPDNKFAYKGSDGRRHFPIDTLANTRHSLSKLRGSEFEKQAEGGVNKRAKELGLVDTTHRVLQLITKHLTKRGPNPPVIGNPVVVTKQADGRLRVIMRASNNFKDRHKEIITEEAHKDYENYIDTTGNYPEFWLWHVKGSRWGEADFVGYSDGFLTVSGLVDEGYEVLAEQLALMGPDLGVSHGFYGISLSKGLIDYYRSFEFSPLPSSHAANIWTAYMLAKEADLPLPEAKRKFFIDIGVPETVVDGWDKDNKSLKDLLANSGIEFKDDDGDSVGSTSGNSDSDDKTGDETKEPTLADVMSAISELRTTVTGIDEKQKALEKKTDDAVASALEAAVVPGRPIGHVASKSSDNVTDDKEVKQNAEWFADTVMRGF